MPYIDPLRRSAVRPDVLHHAQDAGELNFQISILIHLYLSTHGLSYQRFNDIVGALEGAKAEFQRRVVAPYEDRKIVLNGDVYVGEEVNGGA